MAYDLNHIACVGSSLVTSMILGFICVKSNLYPWKKIPMLNKYNFQSFLFVLLFKFPAYKTFSGYNMYPFIILSISHVIMHLLFSIMFLFPSINGGQIFISTLMPATYVNYITIGIPIFRALWGKDNLIFVSMMILCNETIIAPMYFLEAGLFNHYLINKFHDSNHEPRESIKSTFFTGILWNIFTSPINLSMITGLIFSVVGKGVPTYFARIVKIGADGVLCVTLFCIGGFVASHNILIRNWKRFIFSILLKFFIFPMINGLMAWLFHLESAICRCCLLMTTLPCVFLCYFMAENNGDGSETATQMIFWTMILFLPVLFAWILLLDYLKIFV